MERHFVDRRAHGHEAVALLIVDERFNPKPQDPSQRVIVGDELASLLQLAVQPSFLDETPDDLRFVHLQELRFARPPGSLLDRQVLGIHKFLCSRGSVFPPAPSRLANDRAQRRIVRHRSEGV